MNVKRESFTYVLMTFYVEVVNPDTLLTVEGGVAGEVVVSSLRSYTMPLLRYRTDDVGRIFRNKECRCGKAGTLLGLSQGRLLDKITTPNGELHSYVLRRLFRFFYQEDLRTIAQLQFIQTGLTDFVVKAVPLGESEERAEQRIISMVKKCLPYTVNVTVE